MQTMLQTSIRKRDEKTGGGGVTTDNAKQTMTPPVNSHAETSQLTTGGSPSTFQTAFLFDDGVKGVPSFTKH